MNAGPDQAEVQMVLNAAQAALRPLATALMESILALHPKAYVLAWPRQRIISFGFGPKKMSEHYCYLGLQTKHINLGFYHGTSLPDPKKLLEGTGKNLRHIKVHKNNQVRSADLLTLIRAAKAERGQAGGNPP